LRGVLLALMVGSWGAILVGGCAWVSGRLRGRDKVKLWGKWLATIGLCVDGILILTYWIFNWPDLL